ncbi:MAG: GNAT family N-acetyltransferase [Bacteroidales bacterium]|nr:GNAT family N-acetyltransferase [Bacteroidales bacterium]
MLELSTLQLQQLDFIGLQTLVKWAEKEGWNPGPYDAAVFWATDPAGFVGYYIDGELIAGGSIVSYAERFGFMGFFIVKPEFRSQGIGNKLWMERRNRLLSRLKPEAAIGMDGVVTMQDFYRKGGFETAFRDERYERKGEKFELEQQLSRIDSKDFPEILTYDAACFGLERPQFLKPWLEMPQSHAFKYVENGFIKGFSVLRKAGVGYKIGPLFADNLQAAEALYKACLNAVSGKAVFLDIPVNNPFTLALVKKYRATYVFECARMYHGKPPKQALDKIFGVTTFELG